MAKYQTPSGADIDHQGIRPDLGCTPGSVAAALRQASAHAPPARNALGAPVLRRASAVVPGAGGPLTAPPLAAVAAAPVPGFMPGVPLDGGAESLLLAALAEDK